MYGGQAGGGKSDALLYGGLRQIAHPSYKALILRRTFPELRELIDRSLLTFPRAGGVWNQVD
ncbi:MAG TPA: terminase, partial [Methyloceanibacter sp.]|nr:terminase [Methyloceanibacter sp.]